MFRYFAFGVLFAFALMAIWRFAIYRSDVDIALAELKNTQRSARTTESRIAGFDYSPWSVTRGEPTPSDSATNARIEVALTNASLDSKDATTFAALGKFYLADGRFEKAISQFEIAERLDPKLVDVHIDHGSAQIELARSSFGQGNRTKALGLLDKGLGHLEAALKLKPNSPEALFDRALLLETLHLKEQAKLGWKEYLGVDASSEWSREATERLTRLESSDTANITPNELIEQFLIATQIRDKVAGTELIANNRELIARKYLPQSLAMAAAEAPEELRSQYIEALKFAGELEKAKTNDSFAADIAAYYSSRTSAQLNRLSVGHALIKEGYKLCLTLKYGPALEEFKKAKLVFDAEGSINEAQLAQYFVGYSMLSIAKSDDGLAVVKGIADFAKDKKYRWLEMTALYWVAAANLSLRSVAEALLANKQALAIAESIDDKYAIQRNLMEQAVSLQFTQQSDRALDNMMRVLEVSDKAMSSIRQRQRNAYYTTELWSQTGLSNIARAGSLESIAIADRLGDLMFRTNSRSVAGTILMQSGDPLGARKFFEESSEIALSIEDEKSRTRITALQNLETGNALEMIGETSEATEKFKLAAEALKLDALPLKLYLAKRGYLKGLKKLGRNVELDAELPLAFAEIEAFRDKIVEDAAKASFFEKGVSIYDMAVEREVDLGRNDLAFNFSEMSISRSLIDRVSTLNGAVKVAPMKIDEIRQSMPANSQIVKYTVLDDRLLIWLISRTKFSVVAVPIEMSAFRTQVEDYVKLIRRGFPDDAGEIQRQGAALRKILVDPVGSELEIDKSLTIIPNKFLFYLPFGALNYDNGEPLIANFSLTYSPSATVFVVTSNVAAEKVSSRNEGLLAVGNPKFNNTDFEDLPDLPSAEDEVINIGKNYLSPNVKTRNAATKDRFLASLKTSDVVHFAGHYVVVDRDPSRSYLLFSENGANPGARILTNAEIDKLQFPRTKLVVMAACRSGLDNYFDGEGIVGLTRTFLSGGVPVVIASQWSVDSDAAAELMKRFHAHRRNDAMNTSRALRAAQLDLAKEPNGRFNSPYYWAAFAVFGGYSEY